MQSVEMRPDFLKNKAKEYFHKLVFFVFAYILKYNLSFSEITGQ